MQKSVGKNLSRFQKIKLAGFFFAVAFFSAWRRWETAPFAMFSDSRASEKNRSAAECGRLTPIFCKH